MRRPWHTGTSPLNAEERLANRISDRISPRLVAELEILPWWQTQVLALRLYPTRAAPIT